LIVTTFSPKGYKQYGKRFIETYKQFCDYPLIVYVEDDLKIEGVDVRSLYDIPGCSMFLDVIKDFKPNMNVANGYRMNVDKFCRKVFAMTDIGLTYKGKFAFIGADTTFHKKVPNGLLDTLIEDKYMAYLGRKKVHSETDFIAFNTEHSINQLFMKLFISTYTTGAFQSLKYYCDSDVFDHLRVLLNTPSNNLNVCGDERHPFVNSVLGEYADHMKGPLRKKSGKSFEEDYVNK
jgi:hypothetical protein